MDSVDTISQWSKDLVKSSDAHHKENHPQLQGDCRAQKLKTIYPSEFDHWVVEHVVSMWQDFKILIGEEKSTLSISGEDSL